MNGHVVKRGSRYAVVLEMGTIAGKRKQKWISGYRLKEDAENDMIRMLREMQTGEFIEPTKLTVGEWFDEWQDKYSSHLSRKTLGNYESILKLARPHLGDYRIRALRPEHLTALYTSWKKAGISPVTIAARHTALHSVMEQAVKNQILARNPVKGAVLPRQEHHEKRVLTESEIQVLLREAPDTLYTPILLSLYTGMRRGEVLALKWARVKGDRISVMQSVEEGGPIRFKEPKTRRSRRTITIPDFLVDALKTHRAKQDEKRLAAGSIWAGLDLVFCDDMGRILNPTVFTQQVSKLMRDCGIDGATFHSLRHTHATQLMEMGINPRVVQERLGHNKIDLTLGTYSHVSTGMQDDVARALGGVSNPVAVSGKNARSACI